MAYNYLEESDLQDALHDSEQYMQPFFEPLAEIERVTRGRPGKVPAGKPRVTDGTLASIRREAPKQTIQQLPNGKVTIKKFPDIEKLADAVLTDIIIPNANGGGDPFTKAKQSIKDVISDGAAWAYCYYSRTGDVFHADYRRKYVKEVLFEKGKVSEYDSNFMPMIDYVTKGDIKGIMYWQKYLKEAAEGRQEKFEAEWDLKALQELLDGGERDKDDDQKSEKEKQSDETNGYFKFVYFLQKGVGGRFYIWAPAINKCVRRWTNKDPRGIIPLHGFVPEPDFVNPHGEPIAALSVPKQNLQDFNMQMYQYNMGVQNSPPVKKWGKTPSSRIKLVPDSIIEMKGTKADGNDFEAVNINNSAIDKFPANYGLIKSQILGEMGANGDTISAESGNPSQSKTQAGVKSQTQRMGVNYGDLGRGYENWQARIWETCLNIHFAESRGLKELDLEKDTVKRLELKADTAPRVDYDQDYGKIKFTVDASTSQAGDNEKENEKLTELLDIKSGIPADADDKTLLMYNQIVKNSGVDDPEKLMYTDEEITFAKRVADIKRKQVMAQLTAPPQVAPTSQPGVDPAAVADPNVLAPGQVPPAVDPMAQDREAAAQAMRDRGLPEEDIQAMLQQLDEQVVTQ